MKNIAGLPVEASEPRRQGSQQDLEAGSSLLQVYSVYCNLRTVQTVWKPRVHRSLGSSKKSW